LIDALVLLKRHALLLAKDFFEQTVDLLLGLHAVQEHVVATTELGELAFPTNGAINSVVDRDVRHHKADVLLGHVAVFVKIVHIKGQLQLCFKSRLVDFKEPVDEFFEVNIYGATEVADAKESLSDDSRELGVIEERDLVDAFAL